MRASCHLWNLHGEPADPGIMNYELRTKNVSLHRLGAKRFQRKETHDVPFV
jgi:hypothetical protein